MELEEEIKKMFLGFIISIPLTYLLKIIIHEVGHVLMFLLFNIQFEIVGINILEFDSSIPKEQFIILMLAGVVFTNIIGLLMLFIKKDSIFLSCLKFFLITDMFIYLSFTLMFSLQYGDFFLLFDKYQEVKTTVVTVIYIWYGIIFLWKNYTT